MASVYKVSKDGSPGKYWQAQWYRPDGQRITRSTKQTRKSDALKRAHELEAEDLRSLQEAAAPKAETVSTGERLEQYLNWLRSQDYSKDHVRNSARVVKQVLDLAMAPGDITGEMVLDGLVKAQEECGWSLPTMRVRRAHVAAFLSWMYRTKITPGYPADQIRLPNPKDTQFKSPRGIYSQQEIRSLLETAKKSKEKRAGADGTVRYFTYKLAYALALRRAEIFKIKKKDFIFTDDKPSHLMIEGKGGKIRKLPIPDEMVDELAIALREHSGPKGRAFPGYSTTFTYEALRLDRDEAGIPELDPQGRKRDFHSLRTSRITHLADAGCPPQVLKDLARHSRVETTLAFYTKVSQAQQSKWTNHVPVEDEEVPTLAQEQEFKKLLGIED